MTAKNGREFLGKVVKEMPFEVKATQIDGGSEFKAEFEAKCEARRGIDLWVLPPGQNLKTAARTAEVPP